MSMPLIGGFAVPRVAKCEVFSEKTHFAVRVRQRFVKIHFTDEMS